MSDTDPTSNERLLLREDGKPYSPDMELSWQTFLGNRGAMSHDFFEVARIAYIAAWHASLTYAKRRADETSHCIDCIELKNALASAVGIANEARERHARDQDMRVAKILIALSGYLPKYRADTDRIHDVLKRAVDRLSAPIPPEEPAEELFDRYPVGTLFQKKSDGMVLAMTPDDGVTHEARGPEKATCVHGHNPDVCQDCHDENGSAEDSK